MLKLGNRNIINVYKGTNKVIKIILRETSILFEGIELNFEVEEGQTIVGQIVDETASTFTIIEGEDYFTVDSLGNIEFIITTDKEEKDFYTLEVSTDLGVVYSVNVTITDYISNIELIFTTELNFETIL